MFDENMPRQPYAAFGEQYEYAERFINEMNIAPRTQSPERRPFILSIEDVHEPCRPQDRCGDTIAMAFVDLDPDGLTTLINDIRAVLISHGAIGNNHRAVFGDVLV